MATHLQPIPKLRITGAIPPLPLRDFIACTKIILSSKEKLFGESTIKIYKGLLITDSVIKYGILWLLGRSSTGVNKFRTKFQR